MENLFVYRKMVIMNSLKRRVLSILMFMLADGILVNDLQKLSTNMKWRKLGRREEHCICNTSIDEIPEVAKLVNRNNIMNMLLMYHKKYWELLFKWCYRVNIRSVMLISQWGYKLLLIKL